MQQQAEADLQKARSEQVGQSVAEPHTACQCFSRHHLHCRLAQLSVASYLHHHLHPTIAYCCCAARAMIRQAQPLTWGLICGTTNYYRWRPRRARAKRRRRASRSARSRPRRAAPRLSTPCRCGCCSAHTLKCYVRTGLQRAAADCRGLLLQQALQLGPLGARVKCCCRRGSVQVNRLSKY